MPASSTENPSLDELRYYYTGQQNLAAAIALAADPQEFLNLQVMGARKEIAVGENVASNSRFLSVAEPLIVKP